MDGGASAYQGVPHQGMNGGASSYQQMPGGGGQGGYGQPQAGRLLRRSTALDRR